MTAAQAHPDDGHRPDLAFRPATAADVATIVALLADDDIARQRDDGTGHPDYGAAFAAIDRDPNQVLAVVERGGRVIGCLQLTFIPGLSRRGMWRGQIEGVRVAPGHRGDGVGRALFAWAIDQCRARGCGLVQLTTDKRRPEAHRFYEELGFAATHEGMKLRLRD